MTATAMCRHNVDHYVSSCGQCDRERADFEKTKAAYESVSHAINGGSTNVLASVIGREHGYLLNELASAVALGIMVKTYDSICRDSLDGRITDFGVHPEHDGRLSCGTVVGALRTLAVKDGDDVLKSREFWLSRIYQPEF